MFGSVCLHDAAANVLTVAGAGLRSEALARKLGLTEGTRLEIDPTGLAQCVAGRLVYEPDIAQAPFPFPQRLAGAGLMAASRK